MWLFCISDWENSSCDKSVRNSWISDVTYVFHHFSLIKKEKQFMTPVRIIT